MLFNSIEFALFFPLVTLGYFLLPQGARWAWLLVASCLFYMFFVPAYILILLVTILIDYWAAIGIQNARSERRRKTYLGLSIVSTCLVLAGFKYFNFINDNVAAVARLLGWNYSIDALKIILPIGLSFHTFQSLSYVIEVYRRAQVPERHFGIYSLYVMFYPQLVAGPIERPQNLLHQFHERHDFDYDKAASGLRLMAFGFAKKVLIADRLLPIVDQVYKDPSNWGAPALALGTVLFAIQIYCDFSGYSDIARGSARVMGFDLMRNFRAPYLSASVQEFWRRWHVSLSTWFKDYVYLPLGGSRVVRSRWVFNILATFTLSGLWHGANWTYVFWGALNGLYLLAETAVQRQKPTSPISLWLHRGVTFGLICITWVFFRAATLGDAGQIFRTLMTPRHWSIVEWRQAATVFWSQGGTKLDVVMIFGLLALELLQERTSMDLWFSKRATWIRWSVYVACILLILLKGKLVASNFIYFQF